MTSPFFLHRTFFFAEIGLITRVLGIHHQTNKICSYFCEIYFKFSDITIIFIGASYITKREYPKLKTEKRTVEQFIRYLRYEKRYSPHTLIAYRKDLQQFAEYIYSQYEMHAFLAVHPMIVRSWIFALAELGLQKQTINRKISALRSLFHYLKKEGYMDFNPVSVIPRIKSRKKLPEVIPEDAMQKYFYFSECNTWEEKRNRMLISLLYETGMRRSELMELQWKDVDLHGGYIIVMGKRQKQRQIPVRAELCCQLKEYRKDTEMKFDNEIAYVILTDRGVKPYPKWIYSKVKSILGVWSQSVHISPHILRHSVATHLLNGGADIQVIREFLGHSSLAATEIYTHNSIEKLKNMYRAALPDLDALESV